MESRGVNFACWDIEEFINILKNSFAFFIVAFSCFVPFPSGDMITPRVRREPLGFKPCIIVFLPSAGFRMERPEEFEFFFVFHRVGFEVDYRMKGKIITFSQVKISA